MAAMRSRTSRWAALARIVTASAALAGCAGGVVRQPPQPAPPLSPPSCQTSHLRLSVVEADSASGRLRILYRFTNNSPSLCAVKGYPAVSNAGARIRIVDVAQQYTWKAVAPVLILLRPAASAYFAIQVQPSAEFAGDACVAATLAFAPPGDPPGDAAPGAITTCNGVIYVSPLVATPNAL